MSYHTVHDLLMDGVHVGEEKRKGMADRQGRDMRVVTAMSLYFSFILSVSTLVMFRLFSMFISSCVVAGTTV